MANPPLDRLRLYAAAAAALVLAACSAQPAQPTAPPAPSAVFPYAVQDSRGNEVVFDSPPDRIIAFDSAAVEILFAIGEGHRVVGTHDFVTYPPEAAGVARIGDAFNFSIEKAVALKPDLVFVFFDSPIEDLERAGLKVLYVESLKDEFIQIADNIRTWGRITGAASAAEEVASRFQERVEAIEKKMENRGRGPSALQDVGGFWAPGQDTLMGEVFDLLKLRNIAHDVEGYAQISPEVIVERDPAVIIAADPASITGNPAFRDVTAVTDGAVFKLSSDALSIAGPRFIDGVEELAALIYPNLFE